MAKWDGRSEHQSPDRSVHRGCGREGLGIAQCFYFCCPSLIKSCLFDELTVISSPTRRTFRTSRGLVFLFLGALALFYAQRADAQNDPDLASLFSQFRPRTEVQGTRYVGRQVCATCHAQKNRTQSGTAMAHAMQSVSESPVLRSHASLAFTYGRYEYEIIRQGESSLYQVSDGQEKIVEPLLYSFGQGHAGQTYILRHKGKLYESRVSFYTEIDNRLDHWVRPELAKDSGRIGGPSHQRG